MSNILPPLHEDEYYNISQEGLTRLASVWQKDDPQKNVLWTSDYTMELPIRMSRNGAASAVPHTLVERFQQSSKQYASQPALSVKRNGKWQTMSYQQYYDNVCLFAKALLHFEVTPYRSVNILGFNAPEWFIAFYGSIFGYYLPVGIYTTNGPEACQYISEHSDCEVVVLENRQQLAKYLKVWDQLPKLKYAIVYDDPQMPADFVPESRRGQVMQWTTFLDYGRKYMAKSEENSLENRMKRQKPGNCCTLVYTSGTTGQPKGVMLSHDNYVWPGTIILQRYQFRLSERVISFLPLSHVAPQVVDMIVGMLAGSHIFFAGPDALQGSLIETLKEVRPTFFFSVPRIWEKIEEKMKMVASQNGFLKRTIADWAKGIGRQGTFAEQHNQTPPLCFGLAKTLVYNNVKKALGLDEARFLVFGAAPLAPTIRDYFLSLNMFLINGYGMSECAGAETLSDPLNFDKFDMEFMRSTGRGLDGTVIKIFNPDKDGNGEICYRGRNIFMGYYKNEQATRETIDAEGFLHSGDVGKLDAKGNLQITGRIKELLITAGGENVAPVLIETAILDELPFLSNAMVVGDQRKYLTVLLTLKYDIDKEGKLTTKVAESTLQHFKAMGSSAQTFEEALKDPIIKKRIDEGIAKANQKAISKAQYVQKWTIIPGDFTVEEGELTPTLKLKRKVVTQKWEGEIENMYKEAKL